MRKHLVTGIVVTLLLLHFAWAQETAPASRFTSDYYKLLMDRLVDASFSTRETARKELSGLPLSERGTLQHLAETATSPELKACLAERIARMDEELLVNPPLMDIDVESASMADVASALSKATGSEISCWPPGRKSDDHPYTLHLKGASFWDAF